MELIEKEREKGEQRVTGPKMNSKDMRRGEQRVTNSKNKGTIQNRERNK